MNSPFPLNACEEDWNFPTYVSFTNNGLKSSGCLDLHGGFSMLLVDTGQGPIKSMDETSENHPP